VLLPVLARALFLVQALTRHHPVPDIFTEQSAHWIHELVTVVDRDPVRHSGAPGPVPGPVVTLVHLFFRTT
jgi:hypothetical protein